MAKLSTIVSFALIVMLLIGLDACCSAKLLMPNKGLEMRDRAVMHGTGRKEKNDYKERSARILRGRDFDVPRGSPPAPRSPLGQKS